MAAMVFLKFFKIKKILLTLQNIFFVNFTQIFIHVAITICR